MRATTGFRVLVTCALLLLGASGAFGDTATTPTTGAGAATTGTTAGTTTGAAQTTASGAATQAGATASPGTPDLSIPTDAATTWQVGFTVFTGSSLSTQNAYLAYSLPLLLRDELVGLDTHAYADAEKYLARADILRRALLQANKDLTTARTAHDALVFSDTPPAADAIKSSGAAVTAAVARGVFLRALDPTRVVIADSKPVAFKSGDADGSLLAAPTVPLDVFCDTKGLDLVIGGSVTELQGYLVVDVWAYDRLKAKTVFSTRQAAQRDELYTNIAGMGRDIASAILGGDWSLVAYAPSPSRAALYVDGTLVATGAAPSLFLKPGSHEIRVSTAGYKDVTRTVTLLGGQTLTIDDALTPAAVGTVAISSDPSGASLYLDSILQGVTPLSVPLPATRDRGVLSLDGYYDRSFSLEPTSPQTLSFTLEQDHGDLKKLQKQARDSFYFSFGMFALSLPVPLFSYAFANDYAVQYNDLVSQGLSAQAADAKTTYYVFSGTYLGGIAISVALFGWMVYEIINYVTVINGTAG